MAIRYPLVLNGTTIEELQLVDSIDFTSASISGDLTFTGTGARVKANFSDASIANRLLFQTTVANTPTLIGIIPNGTGVSSAIYGTTNSDPTADASYFDLRVSGVTNQVRLSADRDGAAPYYPIAFYTSGTQQMTLDTSGNLNIAGLTASRALATDASKNLVSSTVTSTELGYLSGVTSAIQTQINSKAGTATANTFTNNQIISVSSSSDALRITQTGIGNALVVEDSANPDSTPVVIDTNGRVITGYTATIPVLGVDAGIQSWGSQGYTAQGRFTNDAFSSFLTFVKSRNTSIGGQTVVQSGDALGSIAFTGSDGAAFIRGAQIEAAVDGTPGTNDMPGRLVFSTTADGASSPTERMRIDSAGMVTITNSSTSDALRITQTGAGNALVVEDSANPDSTPFVIKGDGVMRRGTTAAIGFQTALGASYNYPGITNTGTTPNDGSIINATFSASGTNFGSALCLARSGGATVGDYTALPIGYAMGQVSFNSSDGTQFLEAAAISAYVDATPGTNDMPGRLVFSTTADGASSPTERMRIDNQGRVGIGGTAGADTQLQLLGTYATSGAVTRVVRANGTIPSSTTGTARIYGTEITTQAASFTVSSLQHFYAAQAALGLGSAVTNQYGFLAEASLTGATNNYGFYSNIASGTGRYNFYAAGTADNYFAGKMLFGSTTALASSSGLAAKTAISTNPSGESGVYLQGFGAVTNGIQLVFTKTRGATAGDYTSAIQSGDDIAFIPFEGSDGVSALRRCALITVRAEGTFSATSSPGAILFGTTLSGFTAPATRMTIDSRGNIYSTSGTTSMTDGFFYIPSAAGAPSGVPTAVSGRVPMYYDTTNNNFYVYNGAWKKVLLA